MDEKEFSRKSFMKGGGALLVGFSLAGAGLVGKATAASTAQAADVGSLPLATTDPYASVVRDLSQVDTFLAINADNTCSVLCGGMEVGGGSSTGWLMLAAEELDMDMSQMKFVVDDTGVTAYPQGITHSSWGTKGIGPQVRGAAAYGKQTLLGLASTQLDVPVASLTVKSGVVSGGGKSVTYGELLAGKLFNTTVPISPIYFGEALPPLSVGTTGVIAPYMMQGVPPLKQVSEYTLVGTHVPRIEVPDIVTGVMTYIQNVRVPGMVHGRSVWPRGQGALGSSAVPLSVDESSISHIPGAQVVRRGDYVGVVAPHEWDAIQAAAQLKVTWQTPPTISSSGDLWKQMRADDAAGNSVVTIGSIGADFGQPTAPIGHVDAALASAAHVVSQSYGYPYQAHVPIGPQMALADVTPNGARIFTYAQGVSQLPGQLAPYLGLPASRIRVTEFHGSSFMGGSGGVPVELAAAVMSQIVGKPVRLQNMRWDQQGWDTFGVTYLFDMRGGIDANGNIVAWESTQFSPNSTRTSVTQAQLGTPYPSGAADGAQFIDNSAAGVQYNIPNSQVIYKTLPVNGSYFNTQNMRASGSSQTTFATEVFADELAHAANMDPIAFRLQNITTNASLMIDTWLNTANEASTGQAVNATTSNFNQRFLAVINAVAKASNWTPRVAASNLSDANVVTGRGVSFGTRGEPVTFSAAVVEIEVNKKTGKITAQHIYAAQDQGLTVNPAGVENQMVGQVVMNTSRALVEEAQFNTQRVTSLDWVSYPILRFKDTPKVTTIVIDNPNIQISGAGDYVMEHVPSAIANAFFDATGVRIRQVPMTPARVRAALAVNGEGTLGVA